MEHILDTQTMQSKEALARTNMAISEAKGTLIKLQQTEKEYLDRRERLAVEKVDTVLRASRDLLAETQTNYNEVTQFYNTVSSVAEFVSEIHDKFKSMLEDFMLRCDAWEADQAEQEKQIVDMRDQVNLDRIKIEASKASIETQQKAIDKEKIAIRSKQDQIKTALAILKKKQNG